MEDQVPKVGDRFNFEYRGVTTTFEVVSPDSPGKWLARVVEGRYRGLKAVFEQEQALMLIGSFLHAGAAVV